MRSPLISVIIPTYNCENYIDRALESILGQTYSNIEIVVVDDASHDRTVEKVKLYSAECRLQLHVNNVNRRQGAARNQGLDMASGDLVFFLDADDWVHPHTLDEMLRLLSDTKSDVAACGIQRVDNEGKITPYHRHSFKCTNKEEALEHYAEYRIGSACGNKLIAKGMLNFNKLRFIEKYYHEDIIFTGYLALYSTSYVSIDAPYLNYYTNELSTTRGRQTTLHLKSYINIYKELFRFMDVIRKHGLDSPSLIKKIIRNYGSSEVLPKIINYASTRTKEEFHQELFEAAAAMLGTSGYALADAISLLFECQARPEGSA